MADLMRAFLANGSLPPNHSINAYVSDLEPKAAKEALSRGWDNVGDVLEAARGVYGEVDETQSDLASGAMPPISQFRQIAGLPGGATQTTGGGIINLSAATGIVSSGSGPHRKTRAGPGDGSTKKRVRRVYALLRRIRNHDDSVKCGIGRSTQVFLSESNLTPAELTAFDTLYDAIGRVVAEWDV